MDGSQNSFFTQKCEVRAAEDRGGFTVVAKEPIAKGELIVVWSGTLVDGAELSNLPPPVKRHSLQVEEDHYLVSLSDCEPPDYTSTTPARPMPVSQVRSASSPCATFARARK